MQKKGTQLQKQHKMTTPLNFMPFLLQLPWHPLQQQLQGSLSFHLSTGYAGEGRGCGGLRVIVHVQLGMDRVNTRKERIT
jgi:hypothetical protein